MQERTGNADSLSLASGEFVREAAGELGQQSHLLEGLLDLVLPIVLVLVQMVVDETFGHDVVHLGPLVQGGHGVLEDHLHGADHLGVHLPADLAADPLALEEHLAAGDGVDAHDGTADGGLAAAALAHQGEGLALVDERVAKVAGLTQEEIQAYEERNVALVINDYYQAYLNLKEGLEALRPYCREPMGVKATGDEKYLRWFAYQLKNRCSEEADPKAVADLLYSSLNKTIDLYSNAYKHGGGQLKVTSVGSVDDNIAYLKSVLDPLLPPIPQVEVEYEDMPSELREGRSTAFYLVAGHRPAAPPLHGQGHPRGHHWRPRRGQVHHAQRHRGRLAHRQRHH